MNVCSDKSHNNTPCNVTGRPLKIWLLGAIFETTNRGVTVLAESSLKLIFNRWPDAEIIMPAFEEEGRQAFLLRDKEYSIKRLLLIDGRNVFKPNHIYHLLICCLIFKSIPLKNLKKLLKKNKYFKEIIEADAVFDITGGDSFSDLYGMTIFIRHTLKKLLFILIGKTFILLPQTYGPFKSLLAKKLSRYIIKEAAVVLSRDLNGVEKARSQINKHTNHKLLRLIPDIGFVLDPQRPDHQIVEHIKKLKKNGNMIWGLNISGLLFNDDNANFRFGLNIDYRLLIHEIIRFLMTLKNTTLVLIPHVFGEQGIIESDVNANRTIYNHFFNKYPEKFFMLEDDLSCKQIKYIIGTCDFFAGSRMHACIAAMSQFVPTVGLAYSDKFIGVFETVGVKGCVADMKRHNEKKIIHCINEVFVKGDEIKKKLNITIPTIKERIMAFPNEIKISR